MPLVDAPFILMPFAAACRLFFRHAPPLRWLLGIGIRQNCRWYAGEAPRFRRHDDAADDATANARRQVTCQLMFCRAAAYYCRHAAYAFTMMPLPPF